MMLSRASNCAGHWWIWAACLGLCLIGRSAQAVKSAAVTTEQSGKSTFHFRHANRQPFRKSENKRWHPVGQPISLFFRPEAIEISKFSATYFDGNRRHFWLKKWPAGSSLIPCRHGLRRMEKSDIPGRMRIVVDRVRRSVANDQRGW